MGISLKRPYRQQWQQHQCWFPALASWVTDDVLSKWGFPSLTMAMGSNSGWRGYPAGGGTGTLVVPKREFGAGDQGVSAAFSQCLLTSGGLGPTVWGPPDRPSVPQGCQPEGVTFLLPSCWGRSWVGNLRLFCTSVVAPFNVGIKTTTN